MPPLNEFAKQNIDKALSENRLRQLKQTHREDGIYVTRDGKKLISFSCNDYLGLSQHPETIKASIEATEKYGTGSGASRLITGNHPLYEELEGLLANIKNTESALVFGSGYLANIGIIPALARKGDLIIADKLVHASIIDGCKLSGAKLLRFQHNDTDSCQNLLEQNRKSYKNCLIVTDHIFSMDGDIAPVDELYLLAQKYDAWLMIDDAHGLGTIANKAKNQPHIQMGTLSKAIGSYGGYVCADKMTIDYLVGAAKSHVYSTALPPSTTASGIASLKIIRNNKELCAKPLENALLFTKLLGLKDAISPIVPLILGDDVKAEKAANDLYEEGFLVTHIRPPTVPQGTARLRFTFSSLHKTEDIERLVEAIKRIGII